MYSFLLPSDLRAFKDTKLRKIKKVWTRSIALIFAIWEMWQIKNFLPIIFFLLNVQFCSRFYFPLYCILQPHFPKITTGFLNFFRKEKNFKMITFSPPFNGIQQLAYCKCFNVTLKRSNSNISHIFSATFLLNPTLHYILFIYFSEVYSPRK